MATVKFYLHRPKANGKLREDEVSITLVFTAPKIRIPVYTGERIQPKYWDKKAKEAKSNYRGHIELNAHLSDLKKDVLKFWRENKQASKAEVKAAINKAIKGDQAPILIEEPGQKKTSLFTVGRFLVQCKRTLTKKTLRRYKVLWRALARFQNGNRLDLSKMDMSFHDRFKNFLYDIPNENYKGYGLVYDASKGVYIVTQGKGDTVGLLDDTVFKYLVILQTVCEWAVKRGYLVHPSYKSWQIIKRKYAKINLNKLELEAIESLPKLGLFTIKKQRENSKVYNFNINLDHVKDYISILCRTGQRISDVKNFEANQVAGDHWKFTQQKGNRTKTIEMSIPLRGFGSPVKMIFEKYNYKLPKISEPTLNIGIKEVARRAGIDQMIYMERWAGSKKIIIPGPKYEFLSSHSVGKKSFINILSNKGISTKGISDITGTSEKTIRTNYQDRLEEETLIDFMEQVEETKATMRVAN